MKPFTQVRLFSDPSRYGQIVAVGDPRYPHSQHDVQVAWDGDDGKPTGHEWDEIRREMFLEFLFKRGGKVGKHHSAHALLWNAFMVGVGITVWWIALPFFVGYYFWHYLNFKGILR